MTITLQDFASGDTDYIAKLNANNAALKSVLDALEALVGGATGISAASVPKGLQYIFDRKGIIGKSSYKPQAGTLSGPNYNLTVTKGAFWDGSTLAYKDSNYTLSMSGKNTGTYYLNVDSSGTPSVSVTAGARSVWQFAYNDTTKVVSDVALHSGVAILFDGSDYADALESEELSKSFESLADRLKYIESLLEQQIAELVTFYEHDPDNTDGLDFGYKAGRVRDDNQIWATAADTVALTNNATNYVEVNPADGVVSANTSGFTSGRIPLYRVVTSAGKISSIVDRRTWVSSGGGGGGSGHAQNTDTGTTSTTFKLNMDVTGAPTENCELKVKRGTLPDVGIRWNETADQWQFTNDGTTYENLFKASDILSVNEFTKYIGLADPPEVYYDTTRSSSTEYEEIDLSSYITAAGGLHAVMLRVFFWDSSPGGSVNVKFRGKNSGAAPVNSYTVWSNQYGPATLLIPIVDDYAVEFFVTASGTDTANLRVFLCGYLEKVTGVGTVAKEITHTGIEVSADSTADFTLENFCNRGLVHYLKVEEISGNPSNVYDLHLYADSGFSILLYKAEGIVPAQDPFEDWLPFWIYDAGGKRKLRVRIINHDTSQAGVYALSLKAEQFA